MATVKPEPAIKQEDEDGTVVSVTSNGSIDRITPRRRRTWSSWLFNNLARLLAWYTIITFIFRCPSSPRELTDSSPLLCKPYFKAQAQLYPYAQPYYQKYLGPVDDAVRPYAEKFHANVYTPAAGYVSKVYVQHGVPRVDKVKEMGQREWEKSVRPHLDKATDAVWQQYDNTLRPHVDRFSGAVYPYAAQASNIAYDQYHVTVLPLYEKALPYGMKAYDSSRKFIVDVAYPFSRWGVETFVVFIRHRVWPTVRIVYGRNVEPQLAKIIERLGSYRDVNKLEAEITASESTRKYSPPSVSTSSETSPVAAVNEAASMAEKEELSTDAQVTDPASTAGPEPTVTATEDPPSHSNALAQDLTKWQQKFAKAASRGIEDLSARVADIATRQVETQVEGVSNALVTRLKDTSDDSISKLKTQIVSVVADLPQSASDNDLGEANMKVRKLVRSSGQTIKERAQELREWKLKFFEELDSLVRASAGSTLEVLDSIRDLGLQEIGLRWAAMESVDYKDWEEYHRLKRTFDEWRNQVEDAATGHADVAKAKQAAEEAEDTGMEIARSAAEELVRLRNVADWKLQARDTSDDFSDHVLPPQAERVRQKVMDGLSDASENIVGATEGFAESIISAASESAAGLAAEVTSLAGPSITSLANLNPTNQAADEASSLTDDLGDYVSSVRSDASSKAASVYSKIEEGAIRPDRESGRIAQSVLSEIKDGAKDGSEILSEQASNVMEAMESSPTVPSNVYATHDIVDDTTDKVSRSLESVVEAAAEEWEEATDSLAEAATSA